MIKCNSVLKTTALLLISTVALVACSNDNNTHPPGPSGSKTYTISVYPASDDNNTFDYCNSNSSTSTACKIKTTTSTASQLTKAITWDKANQPFIYKADSDSEPDFSANNATDSVTKSCNDTSLTCTVTYSHSTSPPTPPGPTDKVKLTIIDDDA